MLISFLHIFFGLISVVVSTSAPGPTPASRLRLYEYKLPDGYSIERQIGAGELDQGQVYGAVIVAMINLAYQDSRNLTDPVSYSYPAITLNITSADESS